MSFYTEISIEIYTARQVEKRSVKIASPFRGGFYTSDFQPDFFGGAGE